MLVGVLFTLTILLFLMLSWVPGQAPEMLLMQGGGAVSGEQLAELRARLGLDRPIHVQYLDWVTHAIQGDFGRSIRTGRPVREMIAQVMPFTIELALASLVIGVSLGIGLGVLAAVYRNSWLDFGAMFAALLGWSVPNFFLGIILLLVFAVQLGWFPITGVGGWQRLVLPAMTLGLTTAGLIARLTRTEILEQLNLDYVRTARGKGLRERSVVFRHVLKNSLISVVTVAGLQFGRLLGGTVIVETVFARQGVGRVAVDALIARDLPVIQGAVLFLALIFVLTNLIVDLVYGYLDPRIRLGEGAA
jgi:ABC-type dipeptide/oligopeptide/nickel transport system permease component